MRHVVIVAMLGLGASTAAAAQSTKVVPKATDTSFAAMQSRGKQAMGVDQYTSTHTFDSHATGGRITLLRDTTDSAGVAAIRAHLRDIAAAFGSGDFSTPQFVHMQTVPGTKEMAALRSKITYRVRDLPRGAELTISTSDTTALRAVHRFMAFQRGEHHAGGMTHPDALR